MSVRDKLDAIIPQQGEVYVMEELVSKLAILFTEHIEALEEKVAMLETKVNQ